LSGLVESIGRNCENKEVRKRDERKFASLSGSCKNNKNRKGEKQ